MFPFIFFFAVRQFMKIVGVFFLVFLPQFIVFFTVIIRELPDETFVFFTTFSENKRQHNAYNRAGKVRLPRDSAWFFEGRKQFFGHHAPNQSAVIERNHEGNGQQFHMPTENTAEKNEKRQYINQSACTNDAYIIVFTGKEINRRQQPHQK